MKKPIFSAYPIESGVARYSEGRMRSRSGSMQSLWTRRLPSCRSRLKLTVFVVFTSHVIKTKHHNHSINKFKNLGPDMIDDCYIYLANLAKNLVSAVLHSPVIRSTTGRLWCVVQCLGSMQSLRRSLGRDRPGCDFLLVPPWGRALKLGFSTQEDFANSIHLSNGVAHTSI